MTLNEFEKELENIGIKLTNLQKEQLNKYYELLIEYNKVMNLTGITKKEDVYLKHFYDSLTTIKAVDLTKIDSLCDIGTGAGFPGLVLKIVFPNIKILLLDSLQKRVNFLNKVIETLGLTNIETIHSRAEDYAKENRNKFDITISRAVAHTSILLEYAVPMTKEQGYFVALKGNVEQELEESKEAIKLLNVSLFNKIEFNLPIENSKRTILVFKKEKDNINYPRTNSEIKKHRL